MRVLITGGTGTVGKALIELNDNESYSFNQIAEWIEYNVKGV